MFLSSLATLNFSLAFLVGLLASPLSFVGPAPAPARRWLLTAALNLVAPPTVLLAAARAAAVPVSEVLRAAAFAWDVGGTYTPVVVWCVWWPAWLVGSLLVLGRPATAAAAVGGKGKTA